MSQQAIEQATRGLIDKGLLIEAGFVSLRLSVMAPGASDTQVKEMRMAFFAGAQHLFASLMSALDPGVEPTEQDLKSMEAIDRELRGFIDEFQLRHLPAQGRS